MELNQADVAFRNFFRKVDSERVAWKSLSDQSKTPLKALYEYEQMFAQVTRENADIVFGEKKIFEDCLLTQLKMKLEVVRQRDLATVTGIVKAMQALFHRIRCQLVQLDYDLLPLTSIVDNDKPTALRTSYSEIHGSCRDLVQILSQDICEIDFVLQMLTAHQLADPKSIQEQFTEKISRLLMPLKLYLSSLGLNFDSRKSQRRSELEPCRLSTTPLSSRRSHT